MALVSDILWNEYLYILGDKWIAAVNPIANQHGPQKITDVSLFCAFLGSWPLAGKKIALRCSN